MKEEATPKVAYGEAANESVKFEVYVDSDPVERTPLRPTTCPKEDKENSPYFLSAAEVPIRRSGTPFKGSPLLERHMSPRFLGTPKSHEIPKLSLNTPTNDQTPTKGYFEVYMDSTTQNLANELKKIEPKKDQLKNQEENKENDIKQEVVEEFENLDISDVKIKQEVKSGSTVVVRRVFIPSSSKDKL